jgi:hypothetical protein
MAQNNNPLFAGSAISNIVNIATARATDALVADPTAEADMYLIAEITENDGFADVIHYQAIGSGAPVADVLLLWLTANDGTNARVAKKFILTAADDTDTASFAWDISFMNLAAGVKLYVTAKLLAVNVTYNVSIFGGNFKAQ